MWFLKCPNTVCKVKWLFLASRLASSMQVDHLWRGVLYLRCNHAPVWTNAQVAKRTHTELRLINDLLLHLLVAKRKPGVPHLCLSSSVRLTNSTPSPPPRWNVTRALFAGWQNWDTVSPQDGRWLNIPISTLVIHGSRRWRELPRKTWCFLFLAECPRHLLAW